MEGTNLVPPSDMHDKKDIYFDGGTKNIRMSGGQYGELKCGLGGLINVS